MARIKLTVVMDERLAGEMRKRVPEKRRSRFICDAVKRELSALRDEDLRRAYAEAFDESKSTGNLWDGASGDGLD